MEERRRNVPRSCDGIRVRTRCGVGTRNLPTSLVVVGVVEKEYWLEVTVPDLEVVGKLAEYMAYCCAARMNRETTMEGMMIAANVLHEQWVGRWRPLNHFRIKVGEGE